LYSVRFSLTAIRAPAASPTNKLRDPSFGWHKLLWLAAPISRSSPLFCPITFLSHNFFIVETAGKRDGHPLPACREAHGCTPHTSHVHAHPTGRKWSFPRARALNKWRNCGHARRRWRTTEAKDGLVDILDLSPSERLTDSRFTTTRTAKTPAQEEETRERRALVSKKRSGDPLANKKPRVWHYPNGTTNHLRRRPPVGSVFFRDVQMIREQRCAG
jgi:hypothetical protein